MANRIYSYKFEKGNRAQPVSEKEILQAPATQSVSDVLGQVPGPISGQVQVKHYLIAWQGGVMYLVADLGKLEENHELWSDLHNRKIIVQLNKLMAKNSTWMPAVRPDDILDTAAPKREMTQWRKWREFRRVHPNVIIAPCYIDTFRELDFTRPWFFKNQDRSCIIPSYKDKGDVHRLPNEIGCEGCLSASTWCVHVLKFSVIPCLKFYRGQDGKLVPVDNKPRAPAVYAATKHEFAEVARGGKIGEQPDCKSPRAPPTRNYSGYSAEPNAAIGDEVRPLDQIRDRFETRMLGPLWPVDLVPARYDNGRDHGQDHGQDQVNGRDECNNSSADEFNELLAMLMK